MPAMAWHSITLRHAMTLSHSLDDDDETASGLVRREVPSIEAQPVKSHIAHWRLSVVRLVDDGDGDDALVFVGDWLHTSSR